MTNQKMDNLSNNYKTVLILGGTGAMGKHLVSILNDMGGFNIIVTSRQHHDNFDNVTYLKGSAKEHDFIVPVAKIRRWDAIVDFMVYGTTEEFIEHSNWFLQSTRQYVYISSSRVYADYDGPITEDCPRLLDVCTDEKFMRLNTYALEKARDENVLLNRTEKNWTIIRPYVTFSEDRLQLGMFEKEDWLYRAMHGRPIVLSEDVAKCYTTFTYGFDVARGIASIIGQDAAIGEIFHITSSETHTWQSILDIYVSVLQAKTGKKPKVVYTKQWEEWQGGYWEKWKYDRIYNRIFDNAKIGKFIDVSTFTPTIDGIRTCLESFIDNPSFKNIPWEREMNKDKCCRTLRLDFYYPTWRKRIKYFLSFCGLIKV